MSWMYRLIQRNANETSFWMGDTTTQVSLPSSVSADAKGLGAYFSCASASGTSYAQYIYLKATGAGTGEAIAGRRKTVLSAAIGNAHGGHDTLEVTSTGYATGLGTAVRGNIVFGSDTVVPYGTYYAVMGEIYAAGNTSALPTSNACLCCSVPAGTAIDTKANAIAFVGTDGATSMIFSATDASPDWTGSIRILVNGAIRYLHFTSAAAS